jgi:four helix bundle protein
VRDHTKLKVFQRADQLLLETYHLTRSFPRTEAFGLTAQMRRAAISIASNIVEGCGRHSEADFLRFIDIATGSAKELLYQLDVACRLGLGTSSYETAAGLGTETMRMLARLQRAIRSQSG